MKKLLMFLIYTAIFTNLDAIEIADVFSDNMILQRNTDIAVWGKSKDGIKISVSFAGMKKEIAAKNGKWHLSFPAMKANKKPQAMIIQSSDGFEKVIKNILIGDVWLASGQSNMGMKLGNVKGAKEAISEPLNPNLRFFNVSKELENKEGPLGTTWEIANPKTRAGQSAVGYFFVAKLQKELGIPIGLIKCCYGGTITETWCSPEVLNMGFPVWEKLEKRLLKKADYPKRNTSSFLYNRMLKTVMPFAVKGFIWYQGSANVARAEEQKKLFPSMVKDWRKSWGNDNLPFYFVQLPRYERNNWHAFRDAQRQIDEKLTNSFLVITIDLSKDWNPDNHPIHPITKKPIGHRLALAALAKVYKKNIIYSGPVVDKVFVKGKQTIISFKKSKSPLVSSDAKALRGFYLSENGIDFFKATAKIVNDTIILTATDIQSPTVLRYASESDMGKEKLDVNLANAAGLPASPFTITIK